jgi:hypothetical protein
MSNGRAAKLEATEVPGQLPEEIRTAWYAILSEVLHSKSGSEAARHYQFCSGYLQALRDGRVVDQATYMALRDQLNTHWTKTADWLVEHRC